MATSRANATWQGDLQSGSGKVSAGSGSFGDLEVSWSARTERDERTAMTSPEELLGAALASCLNMQFSNLLAKNGTPAENLDTTTRTSFVPGQGVTGIEVDIKGKVPGISADDFKRLAQDASQGCPISATLKGNVEITLNKAELA